MAWRLPLSISLLIGSVGLCQGDFSLEDLNPNSGTYGQLIGPSDYLGQICIVFFGTSTDLPVEAGSVF